MLSISGDALVRELSPSLRLGGGYLDCGLGALTSRLWENRESPRGGLALPERLGESGQGAIPSCRVGLAEPSKAGVVRSMSRRGLAGRTKA